MFRVGRPLHPQSGGASGADVARCVCECFTKSVVRISLFPLQCNYTGWLARCKFISQVPTTTAIIPRLQVRYTVFLYILYTVAVKEGSWVARRCTVGIRAKKP
jgi:hypothetical protein